MGQTTKQAWLNPIPLDLLREPLMWHFAEHYRLRDACKHLQELAGSAIFDKGSLEDIRNLLEHDLPWHILDEENDLFPLLQRRCEAEDQIAKVLDMLSADHAGNLHSINVLKTLISRAIEERRDLAGYREAANVISLFCDAQKRHIAVENAVVLPIARLRLTENDLVNLGRQLATRRGLPDPFAIAG